MTKRRDKTPAPATPVLTLIPGGRSAPLNPLAVFDTFIGANISATHASLSIAAVSLDFWAESVRAYRDHMFRLSRSRSP